MCDQHSTAKDALAKEAIPGEHGMLRSIIENTHAQLAYLNRDFDFVLVNKAYLAGCGKKEADLIGRNHFELFPNAENESIFRRVRDTGESAHFHAKPFEYADQPERGTTYWDWSLVPTKDRDGVVTGLVFSLLEVTGRVRAEQALRESEARLALAVEQAGMAIWDHDLASGRQVWTENLFRILGYEPRPDGSARFEMWRSRVHPDDLERVMAQFEPTEGSVSRLASEYRIIRADTGEIRWLTAHARFMFDRDGKPSRFIGVLFDSTGRKRAEEDLRQAKDAAEAASRAKSDFLAGMSHEMRTPMNGVLGMAELALMVSREPRTREYLGLIKKSGKTLLGIINDVLDLSKIEAGKVVLEERLFDLREDMELVLSALEISAQEKGLRFNRVVDKRVPARVVGDAARLNQVLTNLLGNAIKFTDKGSVSLSVRLAGETAVRPGRLRLIFQVRDTGIGIPKNKLEAIFESFEQVGGPDQARYGGTGLGLAISKHLVELMGGRIGVKSRPGQGSTFFFTAEFGLAAKGAASIREPAPVERQFSPLKVLVAEDNEINRFLAVELLMTLGHAARGVEDGQEALEALREEPFDLVLMDAQMPVMDGEEATRRIRAGEAGDPSIPIVALTAYALAGDRERFLAAGMDDYLCKPLAMEELERVLARFAQAAGRR